MRWMVILALMGCAQSTSSIDPDAPADPVADCIAITRHGCDLCAPDALECSPENVDLFCADIEWPCLPIPTERQAAECRAAYREQVRDMGCETSDESPPGCDFYACLDE